MDSNLELLYGSGQKTNIVATQIVHNKSNCVEVFYRDGDEVWSEYITYEPFLYLNDEDSIFEKLYDDTEVERLLGSLHYNRILHFGDNADYMWWIKKNADDAFAPFTQSQWMIQSGQTQFKGMDFDDPLRMYCDIEVVTKKGYDFPNSSRDEDKITIISMWTNRGNAFILALNEDGQTPKGENVYRCKSEKVLLEKWVRVVRNVDPDIMVWHNGFKFDMPYIEDRAQMLDVELKLGRNGATPNGFTTTIKFAGKTEDYKNYQIYGRHVLDTYFMAKQYDVVARSLDSYGLKACVKELGKESDDRTYIAGDDIADVWRDEHDTYTRGDLINYALDDVKETQILDREWGRNMYAQTKMLPLPMQDVFRYGSGNKIDHLFYREYYKYDWSIPKPEEKRDFKGGYAGTGVYGLVDQPLAYIDVGSMYPTLSQLLGIQPKNDELKIYTELIDLLKEKRYEFKNKRNELEKGTDLYNRYDATQAGMKILLNTASFGYLGSQWGNFNDFDEAERITSNGRKVTKKMLQLCKDNDSTPVKYDTDGALVTVPEKYQGSEETEIEFTNLIETEINKWVYNELG